MRLVFLALFLPIPALASDGAPTPVDGAALLAEYDGIRVDLVADYPTDAAAAARILADHSPDEVAVATRAVADAPDLPAMRVAFAELSRVLVLRFADAPPAGLHVYFCPMVKTYAYWLQDEAGLANPYMGTAMPHCGEGVSLKAAVKAAAS